MGMGDGRGHRRQHTKETANQRLDTASSGAVEEKEQPVAKGALTRVERKDVRGLRRRASNMTKNAGRRAAGKGRGCGRQKPRDCLQAEVGPSAKPVYA